MKKSRVDKTLKIAITGGIVAISLSVVYYFFIFLPQKDSLQLTIRKNVQEAYDGCINKAESDYLTQQRSMCWKYNYDGIDCDLSYFETDKLSEAVPATTLKQDKANCEKSYPIINREYSSTSPSYISPLANSIGNITEGEAFARINTYADVSSSTGKNMASKLKEDFNLSDARSINYNFSVPTETYGYWQFSFYQMDQNGNNIKNLVQYRVNASTGDVDVIYPK